MQYLKPLPVGVLAGFLVAMLLAAHSAPAQEPPAQSDSSGDGLEHVSPQARAFIAGNSAKPLPGALTPELATRLRQKQAARESKTLEALQATARVEIQEQQLAGVPVVIVTPDAAPDVAPDVAPDAAPDAAGIALYIHGGGYVLKSALDVTAVLMARALGGPVCSVEYRLAPEFPFPLGLEDCLAVYRELLQRFGHENIAVFGGSAGGGMALAMLLKARQQGLPMPRALGLFSPWTDLTRTGDSYYANEGRDPVLRWEANLEHFADAYAGGHDRSDPLLSPIHGHYDAGFPPTLIVTGTRDLFLSNSVRLARLLQRSGVDAELRVWEEMFHGFDLMPDLPEGAEARREMAAFLAGRLGM